MKNSKRGKRLFALAMSTAMTLCSVSAFANTISIDEIRVLNSADDMGTVCTTGVELTSEQLLKVTVKLTPGTDESLGTSDQITFLSFAKDTAVSELANTNIQFVEQSDIVTDEDGTGTATFTFRPRLAVGEYTVKAGGTDVTSAASFDYTVKAPTYDMTMTLSATTVTEGETVTVTLKNKDNGALTGATVTATPTTGTAVTATESSDNDGTYTFSNLAVGKYSVTASATGYNNATVQTLVVNAKQTVTIPEDDRDSVKEDLNNKIDGIESVGTAEVTLPSDKVGGSGDSDGYDVSYTITNTEVNDKVEMNDNKITLKDNVFGAKVEIKVTVGDIETTKTVYLVKEGGDKVSFGNLELISDSTGGDAFDDDESFSEAVTTNESKLVTTAAEILNLALGRGDISKLPQGAVDINLDGKVTLAEYRMFKQLISTSEDDAFYKPSNFATARSSATTK